MAYDAWGGSWAGSWALTWTGEHTSVPPAPVVVTDTPDTHDGYHVPGSEDWRKRAQADLAKSANVREQLEAAYAYVTGDDAPAAVREEAQAVTAPYIETGKPQLSRKFSIDWDSVIAAGKGEQIVNAARKLRARRMDEEAVILALL
jgi:hypothetical protein